MASTRENVVFYLNHERITVSGAEVFESLSNWLRYSRAMTGTKVVCSEGDCGACTVILGWMNPVGKLEYRIVDSCIQFLFQLDCCHIITIEALEKEGKLHPAQQTMVDCFGSQCGFCTPGFVMGLAHLCETKQNLTAVDIREKLAGNLCRCTGYEAIVKAGLALNNAPVEKVKQRFDTAGMEKDFAVLVKQSVKVEAATGEVFFKPVNLAEALKLRSSMPQLRIVAGATDLGVQHNKGKSLLAQVMFIAHLHEIAAVKLVNGALEIGAAANWSDVLAITEKSLPEFHAILKIFAAEQIRNAATIGGNIVNASPIADSLACLFALNARLTVASTGGTREVAMKNFYSGYKKFDLKADELLTKVVIPFTKGRQSFQALQGFEETRSRYFCSDAGDLPEGNGR